MIYGYQQAQEKTTDNIQISPTESRLLKIKQEQKQKFERRGGPIAMAAESVTTE